MTLEQQVRDLIGREGIESARASIEEASGLPNAAYTDQRWFQLEMAHVLAPSWIFVASEAELAEAGSLQPVEAAGTPLFLSRDRAGRVNGFHNVCRHRGAALIDAPCRKSVITCPYHQWTYGLDGALRKRPHFNGPGHHDRFDGDAGPELNLVPVRTAVWNGCVFVNPSGDAPNLDMWLQPVTDRLAAYDLSAIRWVGKLTFDVSANWKLVFENYMEGYHVFSVHPRLLKHAPMSVRWSGEWRESVFYNDYVAPALTQGRGEGLPHFPDLTDEDSRRGSWFLRFPHFAAEVFADQFSVLATTPVSPTRTIEEIHLFVVGDEAATGTVFDAERNELFEMWRDLNGEDVRILERLQDGRRSNAYDGGRLSPFWEGPTHQFGRMLVDTILGASRERA